MRHFIGEEGQARRLPMPAADARKRLLVQLHVRHMGGAREERREQAAGLFVEIVACKWFSFVINGFEMEAGTRPACTSQAQLLQLSERGDGGRQQRATVIS